MLMQLMVVIMKGKGKIEIIFPVRLPIVVLLLDLIVVTLIHSVSRRRNAMDMRMGKIVR